MSEARNKKSAMATWLIFLGVILATTWFLMKTMDNTVSYIESLDLSDRNSAESALVGE